MLADGVVEAFEMLFEFELEVLAGSDAVDSSDTMDDAELPGEQGKAPQ